MRQPQQHAGARRRRLVAANELFAGFDQAESFGGVDALRLQHFGRENFANAALEGEASVTLARPGRAAAALRAEIEQPPVLGVAQLRE